MSDNQRILSIETSCDETAVSIVEGFWIGSHLTKVRVLAHKVHTQTSHLPFGGVVPEVAARDHLSYIHTLAKSALEEAQLQTTELSAVAVTMGPGLIGALMVGIMYARGVAMGSNLPLIAVNHVDAHLAPALLVESFSPSTDLKKELAVREIEFPALALTVSGGHCLLSYLKSPTERKILGTTADDACGEAFDKVAKLLGLDYPGGPLLEKLAAKVTQSQFQFPATLADKSNRYGFSFSGLKTAVLDVVRKQLNHPLGKISGSTLPEQIKSELALAFQKAAIGQLEDRVSNALKDFREIETLLVSGGVAANSHFRERMSTLKVNLAFAPLALCSDNATMIGLHALLVNEDGFKQQPFSRYPFGQPL